MTIPIFDTSGALPPIRPGASGESDDRSPYLAKILDVAQRFAHTDARRVIFRGLLDLRAGLRGFGLKGAQWLNGSFVEDCEVVRGRPPSDIDVLSLLDIGDPTTAPARLAPALHLFDPKQTKLKFKVDHYVMQFGLPFDEGLARRVSYWYSMWSHRRIDQRWKGFVEVDLDEDDAPALEWLNTTAAAKGGSGGK